MSNQDFLNQSTEHLTDFFVPDEQKIQLLQHILEAESGKAISFDEAEEVGIQLISLYECLARDRVIVSGGDNEQP